MPEFKYEVVKELGVVSEGRGGWRKELNKISWSDKPAKYDLRDWAPERAKMGKGVTLSLEELKALYELIGEELQNAEEE